MLIDDTRLGETAELEFKRVPNEVIVGHLECRNKAIAAVFAYMFFIENRGSGLLRVQRAIREAELGTLEVADFGHAIRLVIRRRASVSEATDNRGDNALDSLPDEQRRICEILKRDPKISIRKMAESLGIRKNTLDKQLSSLKTKEIVERVGGTRGSWRIIAKE